MASLVYALCLLLSFACAALLWRGYRRSKAPLLLWSSICFIGLAINNLLLFFDLVLFTHLDLSLWRNLSAVLALAPLVYGLVWEAE
jgi:hypothetical protein